MVKDLLVDNIDGHPFSFYDEAARIAKLDNKNKHSPVVSVEIIVIMAYVIWVLV